MCELLSRRWFYASIKCSRLVKPLVIPRPTTEPRGGWVGRDLAAPLPQPCREPAAPQGRAGPGPRTPRDGIPPGMGHRARPAAPLPHAPPRQEEAELEAGAVLPGAGCWRRFLPAAEARTVGLGSARRGPFSPRLPTAVPMALCNGDAKVGAGLCARLGPLCAGGGGHRARPGPGCALAPLGMAGPGAGGGSGGPAAVPRRLGGAGGRRAERCGAARPQARTKGCGGCPPRSPSARPRSSAADCRNRAARRGRPVNGLGLLPETAPRCRARPLRPPEPGCAGAALEPGVSCPLWGFLSGRQALLCRASRERGGRVPPAA